MSLSEEAQKVAQRQADQAAKVAAGVVHKNRMSATLWVRQRTGMDSAKYLDDRVLAVGEYHGDTPVAVDREYPCFAIDDVIVAYDRRAHELYLVCTAEVLGEYLGPRVFLPAGASYTKAQRRKALVDAVGTAMNTAADHPIMVLRDAEQSCPTCGRPW